MSRPLDVVAALTGLTRDLASPPDLETALGAVADVTRGCVAGADHVTVALWQGAGEGRWVAADDDVSRRLGELGPEVDEGPYQHVRDHEPLLRVDRLTEDPRWPRFAAGAGALGACSFLGVRFGTDAAATGVLAVFSRAVDGLSDDAVRLVELLAAHAGLAVEHARRVDNLDAALRSRTVIGLALGMTMERLGLDEDTAFSYLTRVSATSETKLRDVAARMVQQHHDALAVGPDGAPDSAQD